MSANSVAAAAALLTALQACNTARFVDRSDDPRIAAAITAINNASVAVNASTGDVTGHVAQALVYANKGAASVSHVMRRRRFRQASHMCGIAASYQNSIPVPTGGYYPQIPGNL